MPMISSFYGVAIYLYFFDDARHQTPHIHARYQGDDAAFSIADGTILAGEIPHPQATLVRAWLEIHRTELLSNWQRAVQGESPLPVHPLR